MKHILLSLLIVFCMSFLWNNIESRGSYKVINLKLPIPSYNQRKDNLVGEVGEYVSENSSKELEGYKPIDYYKERDCLIEALYAESRGESERGIALVSQVILNRVSSKGFPNTICGVVHQRLGKTYQFSYLNNKNLRINDLKAYEKVARIAVMAMEGRYKGYTKTEFYKKCSVESGFFDTLEYKGREGAHCFFTFASNS